MGYYTPEQRAEKIAKAKALLAEGKTLGEAAQAVGVSVAGLGLWGVRNPQGNPNKRARAVAQGPKKRKYRKALAPSLMTLPALPPEPMAARGADGRVCFFIGNATELKEIFTRLATV